MLEVVRGAFATPALRRLQFGFAGAALGQWSSLIVLSVYAYDSGGAAAVGIVGLAKMLPAALLTPLTGMLADRFARRDVLLVSALLRTTLAFAIAAAVAAGTSQRSSSMRCSCTSSTVTGLKVPMPT
jgi:MFS family permease